MCYFFNDSIGGAVKLQIVDENGEKPKRLWPPNSIAFYRSLKNWSTTDLAKVVGLSRTQIGRLEDRTRRLDPGWAKKIGNALGVPYGDIGYSDSPEAYSWATKAIPVIGSLDHEFQVKLQTEGHVEHIASMVGVSEDTAALTIHSGVFVFEGMFMLFENGNREDMSKGILDRQASGERFIVHLFDGTTWCRRIQPGTRKNRWHLSAPGVEPILDIEIDWVSRVMGAQPGRALPPSSRSDQSEAH